jgi:ABC-type multidrug transport system permease subunit
MVFGTFFMLASYVFMMSGDDQESVLKGMLCWYGLNQAFFGIGGFIAEERMEGSFTNLFLYPINFTKYFIAKGIQILIETYVISLLQIVFFSLLGVTVRTEILSFIAILFINDLIAVNMAILFLCLTMRFKRLSSLNSWVQQLIGVFSGYSVDLKKYPIILQYISYLIPLSYTIRVARSTFNIYMLWLLFVGFALSLLLALFGFSKIRGTIDSMRKKGDEEQW